MGLLSGLLPHTAPSPRLASSSGRQPHAVAAVAGLPQRRLAAAAAPRAAAARRLPAALVVSARGGGYDPRRGSSGGGKRPTVDPQELAKQYALPALGLLAAASLIGPLVGGLVMGALGLGMLFAGAAAALSFSSVLLPVFAAAFGVFGAAGVFGLLGAAAVGTLLIPSLVQLTLIGGGLWLGATVAQRFFAGGAASGGGGIDPDGTIDVEATTVDRDWRDEVFKEQKEREQELQDFDDLLRRREDFKRKGPGRY